MCNGQRGFNLEVALTYEKDPIFERNLTKFFSGKFKILSKKFLEVPVEIFLSPGCTQVLCKVW